MDSVFLSATTPPGCVDTIDLETGTWWRVRILLSSDLVSEGLSPLLAVVSVRDRSLPPSPDEQYQAALLSERILAASVVAASTVPTEVHAALLAALREHTAASARVAALQARADNGDTSEPLGEELAAVRVQAGDYRSAFDQLRARVSDPEARAPWRPVRLSVSRDVDGGTLYLGDLPDSVRNVIGTALQARREATADRLRAFLGG
jgi:hypothetical protein